MFNGSAFEYVSVVVSEVLQVANNLSDLDSVTIARSNLGLVIGTDVQPYNANLVTYATNGNTAYGWGNHALAGYLTSFTEANDLTAAVTWANVPDANITQSSVTQHQAALTLTESQISDLQAYLTAASTIDGGSY